MGAKLGHIVTEETRRKLSVRCRIVALQKGYGKWMIGKKASEETKEKLRANNARFWLGKKRGKQSLELKAKRGVWNKGDKAYHWKGGLPKCVGCGKQLSSYYSKRCYECYHLYQKDITSGENNPNWKGGINHSMARRARKNGAEGSHTQVEWLALKIKYGFMCLCCKVKEPEITLSEDHIIPLSMGGSNSIDNIQPLCISCNSIKYTKVIDYRNQEIAI